MQGFLRLSRPVLGLGLTTLDSGVRSEVGKPIPGA